MAEQAQRRALEAQPPENPQPESHAYEELRQLIVGPEQESLKNIQERLNDVDRRAEDVSSVVAEAIEMRRAQDDDHALSNALAPTIQDTLRESVRRDPHVLADALFPVMGPAIRKSITEALRGMLESFNQALEHSLSWRGIQWRIEAFRTGRPFSEVVLMHSLLFRVEQVFLIHRETGLVLNHVVAPAVATQDPSMVAGMLSAIQQFVKDSFESQRSNTLDRMDVGELEVWIEEGPGAVLASVIRGHAPENYRTAMKEALENIQQNYSSALAHFEGDSGPFRAADDQLAPLLEAQFKDRSEAKGRRPRAALIAGLVVLVLIAIPLAYSGYLLWEWSRFLKVLRQQPGIVVMSYARENGRYHIQGFRDPLAAKPEELLARAGIDPNSADLELKPFYSMEDDIVLKRANLMLHPPPEVKLAEKDGVLRAEGIASPQFIARLEERAPWIAGITSVDDSRLENSNLVEMNRVRTSLESAVLLFPIGRTELESGQDQAISSAQNDIRALIAAANHLNGKLIVDIIGHTDVTGVEGTNLVLSKQRADVIYANLVRAGVKPENLHPRGVGTSEPLRNEDSEAGRRLNRSVTFKVAFSPAPPVN